MYAKTIGSKYEAHKDASTTEIAKLVRADIKALVKSGKLPKVKYSVTSSYYSMGSSITVRFSGITPAFNPAYLVWTKANPHKSVTHYAPEAAKERYSPLVVFTRETLEKILDAYNYNNSDSASDYHDSNFHGHVTFDSYGPGDATYDAELAAALGKEIESEYIAREVEAGNPEILALVGLEAKNDTTVEPAHVAFLKYLGAE